MSAGSPAPNSAYAQLETRFARWMLLNDAARMLDWDRNTVMPDGANEARAEQLSTLAVVAHEIVTARETEDLLGRAAEEPLEPWQAANLREMGWERAHAAAVPADLVAASIEAASRCEMVWRAARPVSDYAQVLPSLRDVLALVRETGQAKAASLGTSAYDALLDGFDPGNRTALIDPVFAELEDFLPGFIDDALAAQAAAPAPLIPEGPFPAEAQKALSARLMAALGFDFERGRLDVSLHPFCGGVPDDVRITTRYSEDDFTQALMGTLHETGHALYERGLPPSWRNQPVGRARGMTVHESQSLLIEMQLCRSPAFLGWAAPHIAGAFGGQGPAWSAANLARLQTRVERSFIRVDADEATYPAHVILRYRLEQAMIAGDLDLADMPGAWGEGMRRLLGVVPPDDAQGCLQDIHWYSGSWGYFPTYTLGALLAAQLFETARAAEPDIDAGIAEGRFAPLLAWLGANVHGLGASLSTPELVRRATGRPLDAAAYKRHLRRRYLRQ